MKIGLMRRAWNPRWFLSLVVSALAAFLPGRAVAGESGSSLSELTFSNLFSEGWGESWSKRQRGDGTPDMSLLRVQTNFLVQLVRFDSFLETGMTAPGVDRSEFVNTTVEYALNRRFMTAVFASHQWIDGANGGRSRDGFAGGIFERFQLIDTMHSSLALNLKMALPAHDLGEKATTWSYALAGWEDLHGLGLGRTGLYWHLQHELAGGPIARGVARNDLNYALSLATSWSGPHAALENFTTFAECAAKTLLDGDRSGRTVVSITPGLRFTLGGRHILMAGVDLPVAGPRVFDALWRLTYICNF